MESVVYPVVNSLFGTAAAGSAGGAAATVGTVGSSAAAGAGAGFGTASTITAADIAAGASAASAAASVAQAAKKTPKIKGPARMPDRDSDAVRQAAARRSAEMQARSGRASTIFTDDRLGG